MTAGCEKPQKPTRHIGVVMKKYSITPAEIRVKQGETIHFVVTTSDVQHGFYITSLGIREPVQPGKPATFLFTAGKKGTFEIECGIICGSGHDEMLGKLIVE